MLKDAEVKRFIEAITEYRELLDHSSDMRDQLESLHKRWERSSAGDLFPSGYATRLMRIGSSRDTHPKTGQNRGTSRPIWHYAALRGTTWHKSAPYI